MMPEYNFDNSNSTNDRKFEIEERMFPNGRKMQAIQREAFEYEDDDGKIKYAIRKLTTADCGCSSSLKDLYICNRCQRIVCHNHSCAFSCSVCMLPTFCFQCMVILDNDGERSPICLTCFAEIKPNGFFKQLAIDVWQFLIHRERPKNEIARRNP